VSGVAGGGGLITSGGCCDGTVRTLLWARVEEIDWG